MRKLLLILVTVLVLGGLFVSVGPNDVLMADTGSIVDVDDEELIADDELSEIEKSFNQRFHDMTDIDHDDLRHFAFGLFESDHDFRAISELAVGLDYIIGPGDNLNISVSGSTYYSESVEVDREGKIDLTDIGTINIWGLTLREAREVIRKEVESYYSNVEVSVTLGELRSISVYVVGEVENPGIKTISSLSTVLHALFEAGGPTSNGSLREVQLIRDNEVIAEMDLYDFILGGVRENNLNLRNDDTVFVRTSQNNYGIGGEVRRPAIYESSDDIRLSELLDMAGGLSPLASTKNILVERIEPGSDVKLMEISIDGDLDDFAGSEDDLVLSDNDIVYIDSIRSERMPDVNQFVTVSGNVRNPGNYSFEDGIKLKEVIERSGGILPETIMDRVEIYRYVSFENRELISLDLEKVMDDDPDHNIELNEWDQINIYADYDILPEKNVTISGEVHEPGTYKLKDGMNLRDLIFAAHEPTDDAYMGRADLYRKRDGELREVITFNLEELLEGDKDLDIELKKGDHLRVYSLEKVYPDKHVEITGEVNDPGQFELYEGMKLSDLIFNAGGISYGDAYMGRADLYRKRDGELRQVVTVNLDDLLSGETDVDVELEAEDQLRVYSLEKVYPDKHVEITGEVNDPGQFELYEGMMLSDLIFNAGGLSDNAYIESIEIYRPNHHNEKMPEIIQKDITDLILEGYIDDTELLEEEYDTKLDEENDSELDNDGVVEEADFELKPGDRVFVRSHISNEVREVSIRGEVNLPGDYVIEEGERLESVVERAGGLTSLAHPYSAKFTRDDVETRQHDQLMNYINYQQRVLAEEEARVLEQTIGDEERSRKLAAIEQQKNALKYMEANLPEGRIIFNLENALENDESAHNLILADGDRLVIPARPQVVIVSGEVYNPESIVYEEDLSVDDYINRVGGIRETGSEDDIYILRADGSVTTSRQGIDQVNEGDIIVVPPAEDRLLEGGTN